MIRLTRRLTSVRRKEKETSGLTGRPATSSTGYPDQFKEQHLQYLGDLNARGVTLSFGSDCHDENYGIDLERAAALLERVGIRDETLWRLPPRA
jgi:hypothetical protein